MKIGYARVSTQDQNLDLQIDALKKQGCEQIYSEKITGTRKQRPQLDKMLEHARKGDVIVIWKLDRIGRSTKHLIALVDELNRREIGLKSIHDPIDTTNAQGRLVFKIFAALAEFEHDIISERTRAGLEAARARGRVGGRPKGLSQTARLKAKNAAMLYQQKDPRLSIKQICDIVGISSRTLYNYLDHEGVKPKK